MSLNSRYLFFAHDAGAGNMIVSYAYFLSMVGKEVLLYPTGPAFDICKKNLPEVTLQEKPDFRSSDIVMTGLSGMHSRYEVDMIAKARISKVKKIFTILDCEYNFEERFIINGKLVSSLPDIILAPKEIFCSNKILKEKIVTVKNLYAKFFTKVIMKDMFFKDSKLYNMKNRYILILTEYVKEQYGYEFGYTEFEFLENLFEAIKKLEIDNTIILKMHPAEFKDPKKYDFILKKYPNLNVFIKNDEDVYNLIYNSKIVFGIHTSLFEITNLLGKKAYSVQIYKTKDFEFIPKNIEVIDSQNKLVEVLKKEFYESDS